MSKNYSLYALILCFCFQFFFGNVFYPKYDQRYTEATIGWDVSGYYFYLPSIFIYKDLKQIKFKDEILKKYQPTPNLQQAYLHSSGNYIMKYSIGQSFHYLPWFGLAHIWASLSPDYHADGFSYPYQFMISIGMLFLSFLGLWFLRKVLLKFFNEKITALTLISIVLGSNYLEYSAISGAMTHNSLFTLYALLLYATIRFHEGPKLSWALIIGGIIGWAALIRPTEIIAFLIPIFWGLKGVNKAYILEHFQFLKKHIRLLIPAGILIGAIGFIQLIYWKYAGGEWIIYSYQDQGFDWLKPHFKKGMFSYKTGWLVYSPVMIFSLLGFYALIKRKMPGFLAVTSFSLVFLYLCFAWQEWWYGGSLGIRAMVQSYPILALSMAAFYDHILKSKIWSKVLVGLIVLFSVYNLWLTRHAHRNGVLHVGHMTSAYFWKVLGKSEVEKNALKLLDTDEEFRGERSNINKIYSADFEKGGDSICNGISVISGNASLCINKEKEYSPKITVPISDQSEWIRVSAKYKINQKEWDIWRMTQLVIRAVDGSNNKLKQRFIRLQRHLEDRKTQEVYMDFSLPKGVKHVEVYLWISGSDKSIMVDDLEIETFN